MRHRWSLLRLGSTGLSWSAGGFVSVGGSLLWGVVADRRGSRLSLMAVLSIQATALLILSMFNNILGY
jgi:MFS family permease